jgi:hypothetical protein
VKTYIQFFTKQASIFSRKQTSNFVLTNLLMAPKILSWANRIIFSLFVYFMRQTDYHDQIFYTQQPTLIMLIILAHDTKIFSRAFQIITSLYFIFMKQTDLKAKTFSTRLLSELMLITLLMALKYFREHFWSCFVFNLFSWTKQIIKRNIFSPNSSCCSCS